MIESAICAALASVTELTGGIFVGKADPGAAYPYAVLQTSQGTKSKSGKRDEFRTPVTLAIYSESKTAGRSAADACRAAMEAAPREGEGVYDLVIRAGDVSTRAASRTVYLFQIAADANYTTTHSPAHTDPAPDPEPDPEP